MTYGISQVMNTSLTYGWLITQVVAGGPADEAGLRSGTKQAQIAGTLVTVGGDIIIGINDTRITNIDDLSTYLEEYTLPGQTVNIVLTRSNEILTLSLKLEARSPST